MAEPTETQHRTEGDRPTETTKERRPDYRPGGISIEQWLQDHDFHKFMKTNPPEEDDYS